MLLESKYEKAIKLISISLITLKMSSEILTLTLFRENSTYLGLGSMEPYVKEIQDNAV